MVEQVKAEKKLMRSYTPMERKDYTSDIQSIEE